MPPNSKNLRWHKGSVSRKQRAELLGHQGCCLWLTGLSGAGKSTIARRVEQLLVERGVHCYVLDGDNLRMGLNKDLGFKPEDRQENIRRVTELARLFVDSGAVVLCAFISPYRADRDAARRLLQEDFAEVFIDADLATCEQRDPKGLYQRARNGEIDDFTGISAPYQAPENPELSLDTGRSSLDQCADQILQWLEAQGLISKL
ncbi:MAG: adenylyl-sulfate kinase [Rickettsiales bacterium]|nr:adenylyl-sulfate kinase [Rickettsiales bacterium]